MRKVTNGNEFRAAMEECAALSKRDTRTAIQKLSLDGFTSLVQLTAKDTGYARNNWDVSVDSDSVDNIKTKPKGSEKDQYQDATFKANRSKIRHNSKVTLYNNTAYIKFLEDGTPSMEAQPMVKPTQQKLYKQAEELCKALSAKKYDI